MESTWACGLDRLAARFLDWGNYENAGETREVAMRAGHRMVLKLIATALIGGAVLLGTIAPGAGPATPPYWAILTIVAAALVLLWVAVWWDAGDRKDPSGHSAGLPSDPDLGPEAGAPRSVQLRRHHHLPAIDRPQSDVEGDVAALKRQRHVDAG